MELQQSSLDQLTAEILIFKQQTAVNIIEIGRRLIRAKEILPHGAWGKWLEERVEFSQWTANKFMRAAREFSNCGTLNNLHPSKVIALLDVPAEEREQFVQEPHELPTGESKTVDQMTTRELQEAIKARKRAEAKTAEAEARAKEAERQALESAERATRLLDELKAAKQSKSVSETIPPDVQQKLSELAMVQREYNKIAAENKRLKLELEATTGNQINDRLNAETKVSTFTGRIKIFLREMAPLGYMAQEVMRTSPQAQKDYESAISALEKWCRDMRDAMIRPEKSKIIDVEVS